MKFKLEYYSTNSKQRKPWVGSALMTDPIVDSFTDQTHLPLFCQWILKNHNCLWDAPVRYRILVHGTPIAEFDLDNLWILETYI